MSADINLQVVPGRSALPMSRESQLVYAMVIASPQGKSVALERLPLNLCLVIDRSSSMQGERLDQVKEAARHIVDQMEKNDYFSLVTFHDSAQVVIPSQLVREKELLKRQIDSIEAMGGTEMAQGMEAAAHETQKTSLLHGISHVILLTDGRTYGDESRCVKIARKMQEQKIGITALGIGHEWNEDLLELIAASENSHTRYITSSVEIYHVFVEELKRMYSTFAQNVQILIEGRSDCLLRALDRVQPYIAPIEVRSERNIRWIGNLGNWPDTDTHAFMLEMVVPPLEVGSYALAQITLRYRLHGANNAIEQTRVMLHMAVRPADQVHADVEITIKHWMERLTAYRLQDRAWKNVATGNIGDAAQQLEMAGTRLLGAGDSELAHTVHKEASQLLQSGKPSAEGRKRIKYGTRGLVKRPPSS